MYPSPGVHPTKSHRTGTRPHPTGTNHLGLTNRPPPNGGGTVVGPTTCPRHPLRLTSSPLPPWGQPLPRPPPTCAQPLRAHPGTHIVPTPLGPHIGFHPSAPPTEAHPGDHPPEAHPLGDNRPETRPSGATNPPPGAYQPGAQGRGLIPNPLPPLGPTPLEANPKSPSYSGPAPLHWVP